MTTRKSYKTEICAECNKIIPAGTQFAVLKIPSKKILFEPIGKVVFTEEIICLSHVYRKAEKKIKQFTLLGVK